MSVVLIAFIVGLAMATFVYVQLARTTGNASPGQNLSIGGVAGAVAFLIVFTLLKFIF